MSAENDIAKNILKEVKNPNVIGGNNTDELLAYLCATISLSTKQIVNSIQNLTQELKKLNEIE